MPIWNQIHAVVTTKIPPSTSRPKTQKLAHDPKTSQGLRYTGCIHISNGHGWLVLERSKFWFLLRCSLAGFERGGLLGPCSRLRFGQVFLALACGWDDRSEMDALLAADKLETERLLNRVELEGRLHRRL
jgi:hypothetical protein